MVVTDLGLIPDIILEIFLGIGAFSLYNLNARTRSLKLEQQVVCFGDTEDKFQFISGVKFDANCELFMADARGHSLKVFLFKLTLKI